MSFHKSFNNLPRLVQILLLLIPVVNWVTEILVRVSAVLDKGTDMMPIVGLILAILPTGNILGWIDVVSCLLQHKLILT